MNFRIADTFSTSLAKLTAQEQKAVKTTAFDLQMDASHPGLQFHRIDRARDPGFWTVRVNRDLRIVVHRRGADMLLAYVGHHDGAYAWAERRRLDVHPTTGAVQLVEIRELVEEIVVHRPVERPVAAEPLFAGHTDEALLACGVPPDWLDDIRSADEDRFLALSDHLPREAAEALFRLAAGEPAEAPVAPVATPAGDPFEHPDAQRRFRTLADRAELERALEYPWELWTVFLHPSQRDFVERSFSGPARVSGSAGTGKTVVAIHRAARLARLHPEARVLLTTFTEALANALKVKLRRLAPNEPEVLLRIAVRHMKGIGQELHEARFGKREIASGTAIDNLLAEAREGAGAAEFPDNFLRDEWRTIVDAWGIRDWETYSTVPRLGRKTRIGGAQREKLWSIFERVRAALAERRLLTWSDLFHELAADLTNADRRPFTHAVVDEAQDLSVAELRFLAALAGDRPDGLFFAGDLGQRIFRQPFSWKALGVDVRGRSRTLRVNYRTSHQIRSRADVLLPKAIADVDGNEEARGGIVSVFNGPSPQIEVLDGPDAEIERVADWLRGVGTQGVGPGEIGLFTRTMEELPRAREAVELAGLQHQQLSGSVDVSPNRVSVCTMHVAKGLEFRAVVVMACDDEVIPLASRIESISDESDLKEVYDTERHLLYVACTRARDHLLVTGVDPASEFLDDLMAAPPTRP